MARGRRGRRPQAGRQVRKRFLIVCEGEKTEPNYFRSFPVAGLVVEGPGMNTLSLVERTEQIAETHASNGVTYDEVWCVFDKDDFGDDVFNSAIKRVASLNGSRAEDWSSAWSNQSFELWYVLHFDYLQSDLHRSQYVDRLVKILGSYAKNAPEMYRTLLSRQPTAISFAENLIA